VDRILFGGNVGKKTAIGNIYDFDLVVFINDEFPPFEKILDEFEGILRRPRMK